MNNLNKILMLYSRYFEKYVKTLFNVLLLVVCFYFNEWISIELFDKLINIYFFAFTVSSIYYVYKNWNREFLDYFN